MSDLSAVLCNLYLTKKEILDAVCREHINYRYKPNYKDSVITPEQNGKFHIFLVLEDRPREDMVAGIGTMPVQGN